MKVKIIYEPCIKHEASCKCCNFDFTDLILDAHYNGYPEHAFNVDVVLPNGETCTFRERQLEIVKM